MSYVFKCKMCGGELEILDGSTVCECEFCGTKQTVPAADNEKKMNLFNRANRLRFNNEFDKAAGIYESIITDFPEEPEAYWGLVLCKYGIEYVDDPATGKKIPTCHRSSFESVFEDSNFDMVMGCADDESKRVYRDEAKQIEELRKGIVEVSSKEEPYDIFICYKETDKDGNRTLDSVLAQDIYDELTDKGYKVFFSRITLEDKLGTEYEPYIFAALHSAKVMLAVGTQYEYYDAVWVKNEWSRFLQLIAAGEKKTLIPVYKNLDAYDMPKEFARLQAQDMGKVGAMQDLLRGIDKIFGRDRRSQPARETVVVNSAQGIALDTLLKRGYLALEDGSWEKAEDFSEQVLNHDPENADAYVIQLLKDLKVRRSGDLSKLDEPFDSNSNYQKAVRYGSTTLKASLNDALEHAKANQEEKHKAELYEKTVSTMKSAKSVDVLQKAIGTFETLSGFRDADDMVAECNRKIDAINEENRRKAEARKKNTKTASIIAVCIAVLSLAAVVYLKVVVPSKNYDSAVSAYRNGEYAKAGEQFTKLGNYKDSSMYSEFIDYVANGQFEEAITFARSLDDSNVTEMLLKYPYEKAVELSTLINNNLQIGKAIEIFGYLGNYSDAEERMNGLIEQYRSYGNRVLKSSVGDAVTYYLVIPENARTTAEQNLVNLYSFNTDFAYYNKNYYLFDFVYNKDTGTITVSHSPESFQIVGYTVFDCDGHYMRVGKLTGQGEGSIMYLVSSSRTITKMSTTGKVALYFTD